MMSGAGGVGLVWCGLVCFVHCGWSLVLTPAVRLATCVPPVCHYTIHFPPAQGSIHCQDAAVILIQDTLLPVQGFSNRDINERSSSTSKFKDLCQPNPNFRGETVLQCPFLLVARCLVNSKVCFQQGEGTCRHLLRTL